MCGNRVQTVLYLHKVLGITLHCGMHNNYYVTQTDGQCTFLDLASCMFLEMASEVFLWVSVLLACTDTTLLLISARMAFDPPTTSVALEHSLPVGNVVQYVGTRVHELLVGIKITGFGDFCM